MEDIHCQTLQEFHLAPPTLHGDEDEKNALHQLEFYPRAPSFHEATITDKQMDATYNSTNNYKNTAAENMLVRLSSIFHNLHGKYRQGLIVTCPFSRLERIHLQIISMFVKLIALRRLSYLKSSTGILEFI